MPAYCVAANSPLNSVLKLKSLPKKKRAYSCVFEPENTKLFEESESEVPPLGIRILPHLEKSKLIITDHFYRALVSALEQTHCARM